MGHDGIVDGAWRLATVVSRAYELRSRCIVQPLKLTAVSIVLNLRDASMH